MASSGSKLTAAEEVKERLLQLLLSQSHHLLAGAGVDKVGIYEQTVVGQC